MRCLKCKKALDAGENEHPFTCPICGWVNVVTNSPFEIMTIVLPITYSLAGQPHSTQYCYPDIFLGPEGRAEFDAMETNIQQIIVAFLTRGWRGLNRVQKAMLYRIRANTKFSKLATYYAAKTRLQVWLDRYRQTGK